MIRHRTLAALTIIFILAVTLSPSSRGTPPEEFSWCIACGPRGLADGILNLCLFVPLGLVLGWKSTRPGRAILFAFMLSCGVEVLQTIIPGRDPSVSDITFNSAGAILGALLGQEPHVWLRASERLARTITVASVTAFGLVILLTATLLSPADGQFLVSSAGNDVVVRYNTRAGALGLDEPEYRLRGVAEGHSGGGSDFLRVRRERATWLIDTGGTSPARLGPTVGQGWALLVYPDAIGARWGWLINGLWIAVLCLPIGYFARERFVAMAIIGVAILLGVVPLVVGVPQTTGAEWFGAACGIAIGLAIARFWKGAIYRDMMLATPPS